MPKDDSECSERTYHFKIIKADLIETRTLKINLNGILKLRFCVLKHF
jgi:hypothetical protein